MTRGGGGEASTGRFSMIAELFLLFLRLSQLTLRSSLHPSSIIEIVSALRTSREA